MSSRIPGESFLTTVCQQIKQQTGLSCPDVKKAGLLVALSGGPDSVALLLAAAAWSSETNSPLAAAHLNHKLRGDDASTDAQFCHDICCELGVTLYTHQEDPRPVARLRKMGLEEAGRHLRRRFFESLLAKHVELNCIATGHHLDDQTETVIMRLFRGTGPDGLRGIRPVQNQYIHPLLTLTRQEILAFLETRQQPWRTDTSNLDGSNLRSRLRRELLPVVRDIFGSGSELLPARLASLLDPDLALLNDITDQALEKILEPDEQNPVLSVNRLLSLNQTLGRRVIRRYLMDHNIEPELIHIDLVLNWLTAGQSGTKLNLPNGCTLCRNFDRLFVKKSDNSWLPRQSAADYRIRITKLDKIPERSYLNDDAEGSGVPQNGPWVLTCPAETLCGNIRVRNWLDGDRFNPLGLNGSKKLSDLLRERRVPATQRENILVVTDDTGILWVVGLARDERTRILPTTSKAVTIMVIGRTPSSD